MKNIARTATKSRKRKSRNKRQWQHCAALIESTINVAIGDPMPVNFFFIDSENYPGEQVLAIKKGVRNNG